MSFLAKVHNVYTQNWPPRPTFTQDHVPDGSQKGRVFIVTGGSGGIGFELCKMLYKTGATLHYGEISELNDLNSVRKAAQTFDRQETRLDVLWNNAGMGPSRVQFGDTTAQGIEPLFGVHCVAGLYFAELLVAQLRFAARNQKGKASPRVVWLTSGFADTNSPENGVECATLETGVKDRVSTYATSKAGVWILCREFARRHREDGIICLPLNPGNAKTGSYSWTGAALMFVLNTLCLYESDLAAYTGLYGGLSPDMSMEQSGLYVIPWGRVHSDKETVRQDILRASAPKEEGGLGYGALLWELCEKHWKSL